MMTISVIICTLDNWKMLDNLLESISLQNVKPNEIIIIHGEKNPETANIHLKWNREGLNIIYRSGPRSLVTQRNMGIDLATGEIICFLDDDVILEEGYFNAILNAYIANATIGGVQGTITNNIKPKLIKRIFYHIFFIDELYGNGKLKRSGSPSFHKPCQFPIEVEVFNGCLMTFRRDVISISKFDDWFTDAWLGDDVDTSYNVSRKYKLLQIPDAKLYHYGNSSFSSNPKLAFMRGRNFKYIRNKYNLNTGLGKLICLWSDIGIFFQYLIIFLRGNGIDYLKNWLIGLNEFKDENSIN